MALRCHAHRLRRALQPKRLPAPHRQPLVHYIVAGALQRANLVDDRLQPRPIARPSSDVTCVERDRSGAGEKNHRGGDSGLSRRAHDARGAPVGLDAYRYGYRPASDRTC